MYSYSINCLGVAVKPFQITVRTDTACMRYTALAVSSPDAAVHAAELFGDIPCGITVTSHHEARHALSNR